MKHSYEMVVKCWDLKVDEKDKSEKFIEIPYEIETETTENSCIEHVTKNMSGTSSSLFADSLTSNISAVKILINKLQSLIAYVEGNKEVVKKNPGLLRELKELCANYPKDMDSNYKKDLMDEFNETAAINMLTSLMLANKTIQDVLNIKIGFDTRKSAFEQ